MSPETVLSAGSVVPADSVIAEGEATVDESAVTGESAPVVRDARPGRHTLLAGSRVLTGSLRVRPLGTPVAPARRRRTLRLPSWWPAAVLPVAMAVYLLEPKSAAAGGLVLLPYLTLLALGAARALDGAFWRRLRAVPLAEHALSRAAACDTLVVPTAAVREDGTLVAVEFWPLAGVSARELAGAARQGSLDADGGPGRSVVVLAKDRAGRVPIMVREAICGPPDQVAGLVAARGGAWPQEARDLEHAIAARGGESRGVADGGRPLGMVELRPAADRPSLDDVAQQGIALSFVDDPALIADVVCALRDNGHRVAVGLEAGMPESVPAVAHFTIGGPGWGAARPTALDLDADPSKLPEVLVGVRRLRRQTRALVALAGVGDAYRIAGALVPIMPAWILPVVAVALVLALWATRPPQSGRVNRNGSGGNIGL